MANIQQKLIRPRIGSSLCLEYQDIRNISRAEIGVFVSENKPLSFKTYFKIMEYQMKDRFKIKDSEKFLSRCDPKLRRSLRIATIWKHIHVLIKESGSQLA